MYNIPTTVGSPPKEPAKFDPLKPTPKPRVKLANLDFSQLKPEHNTIVPLPPSTTNSSKQLPKLLSPRGEQKVKSVANLIEVWAGKEQSSQGNEVSSRQRSHTQAQVKRPSSLDREYAQFQQGSQKLAQLSTLFTENFQLINQQTASLIGNEHEQELSRLALREFTKNPSVREKWIQVRQLMDEILNSEEIPEAPTLTFKDLDLEKYLQWSFEGSRLSTHSAAKTFREPNQKIVRDFLMNFLLDPDVEQPLRNKSNIKKMDQFSTDSISTTPTPTRLFNYLTHLVLMSELLKVFPQELLSREKEPIFITLQKLIRGLENLKEVKDLEKQGQSLVKSYCYQTGELLQQYVKLLATVLRDQIQQEEEGKRFREFLYPNLKIKLQSYLKSPCSTFEADFKRAINAQFLIITSDDTSFLPELTEQVGKDKEALEKYSRGLLKFFMHYLKLEDSDQLQLLLIFTESPSLTDFYNNLQTYPKVDDKGNSVEPPVKLEVINKLLTIFRAMNQALLLGTHTSILSLEKMITNNQDNLHHKLIREYPTASSNELLPHQKLDKETKTLHFHFADLLTITVKRVGALDSLPSQPKTTELSKCFYPTCAITSTTTFTISLPQMESPTAPYTEIEIQRPPYTIDLGLPFLQRYAALITTLETMGINYHIV